MKKLVACSCALMLVLAVGTFAPQPASAQEQGETTSSNNSGGFGSVIRNIFGGGNNPAQTGDGQSNPAGTGGMPNPFSWFGGGNSTPGQTGTDAPSTGTTGGISLNPFSWFSGGNNAGQTGGGSANGSGDSSSGGVINWFIDVAINFRNENNLWSNEGGNGIINVAQDTVGSLITGAVNLLTGEVDGTPEGTNAIGGEGPVDLTPGGANANADSDDSSGSRPADATGRGRGHNPSGLGGLGSPSNPLGTGASDMDDGVSNSDAIGTNNVETQTSPYLFAPVPGGENNAGEHPN